ncbi:transcriptional regulator [Kitasatospora herbaricolor]|uniref:helix-turn-helix transcriptional regulator n=1 Tax=Kitasatospora herbaricolor TaxID=68217 RepID=UPI00174D9EAF|nr:AraC family transcriptional regulator [Kitasatospora herbaricolor]MDQ0309237.1 AraC-like DNA-binding protein [Kitasatospora herbaricolor]GGV03827.1 transcriptional regulator [Kitasatospora herbaricolor]
MCHPGWHRARIAAQHLSDLARLRRVRDRIDREYRRPLDVEALARGAGMPAGQLSREFRLAYGRSPYAYLTARRIEHATALLRRGGPDPAGVWAAVGCSSPGVFAARFTELVGMPPGAFRLRAAGPGAALAPRPAEHRTGPVRNREAPAAEPQLA